MEYHIDQSGKVEDTNKLTVIAFANWKVKSLISEVGRKSLAHLKAIAVFRGEVKPDIIVKAGDVLSILYKQKNRWSARSGRENP